LDSASFYSAIPVGEEEQLFGIFYLLPGTLYQCQAAMELKRRSWQCAPLLAGFPL
jgi:CCR4-NOT transcriptional regulation complex NOT5 subunit